MAGTLDIPPGSNDPLWFNTSRGYSWTALQIEVDVGFEWGTFDVRVAILRLLRRSPTRFSPVTAAASMRRSATGISSS